MYRTPSQTPRSEGRAGADQGADGPRNGYLNLGVWLAHQTKSNFDFDVKILKTSGFEKLQISVDIPVGDISVQYNVIDSGRWADFQKF